jgi:hypothetical protein
MIFGPQMPKFADTTPRELPGAYPYPFSENSAFEAVLNLYRLVSSLRVPVLNSVEFYTLGRLFTP